MNEREDAIRLWARNKIASDAFQDQWSRTDQEARRLLSIYEAQRDGRPIPGFERPQPSPLISSLGEEDATDWEEDFDVPISRHGSVLPHNLLSPTPTSEAGIGETAFKYASMNLNDKRQSGVDSGYDSGKTSGSVSTALAPGVSDEKPTIRWDEPHERVNSEATWQAAWDAVIPEPSSTESDRANLTVNEWEYTYAQE